MREAPLRNTLRRGRRRTLALLYLALPAQLAGQEAVPGLLDLSAALEIAQRNNPGLLRVRNDATVADWDVRQAYGRLLPAANASGRMGWQGSGDQQLGGLTAGDLGFGNQPSYYSSSYDVGVSYTLDWATLRGPARARADREATLARIDAAGAEVNAQVTTAYVDLLRRQELLVAARQRLENAGLNLRLAEGQMAVGTVTPIDVGQAEVQVGRAEVQVVQAENEVETARMRLLQAMGVPVHQELSPATALELSEPTWSFDELRGLATVRNPGLRAIRLAHESAEIGVSAARSPYLPSLSISTGWGGFAREASDPDFLVAQAQAQVAQNIARCVTTNDLYRRLADPLPPFDCAQLAFTDPQRRAILEANDRFPFGFRRSAPSVSLGLSLPIFQGFSRQRNLEAARIQREDVSEELREREIALEADLRIALADVRTAYRSALLEERNRDLAERQVTLARERYQVGAITFVELMDAETLRAQAEADRVVAVYVYHDAVTRLEALLGTPLRD